MKKILLLLAIMLIPLVSTSAEAEPTKRPVPTAQAKAIPKTEVKIVELEKGSGVPIPAGGKSEFLQMSGRPCTKVTDVNGNITFYFIKK